MAQTVKNLHAVQETWISPGSGISSGEQNGYKLQYSCLENSTDRGAQQVTVHGVAESYMTEQLTHFSHLLSMLADCSYSVM